MKKFVSKVITLLTATALCIYPLAGVSAAESNTNSIVETAKVNSTASTKAVAALESGSIPFSSGQTGTRVHCNSGTVAVSLTLSKATNGNCQIYLRDARNHYTTGQLTVSCNGTVTANFSVGYAGDYALYFVNIPNASRANPLYYTIHSIRNV